MTITGIEGNRYFLFNPIWVEVTDAPSKINVNVNIDGIDNYFNFYSFGGKIKFDIGKLVLGLVKNIKNKEDSLLGSVDGAYKVSLTVRRLTQFNPPSFQQIKYFILGGKKSYDSNVIAPVNLSLTNFAWQGFPRWTSQLTSGIVNTDLENYNELQPRVNCNNIFIAFRNNLGGFSYYLFEDYSLKDKNQNKGYYLTQRDIKIPGVDARKSISVRSKVHRDFYETISHLSDSFEIYIWNQGILDSPKNWVRVNGSGNNTEFNPKLIATDVEFHFEVVTNFNKVW